MSPEKRTNYLNQDQSLSTRHDQSGTMPASLKRTLAMLQLKSALQALFCVPISYQDCKLIYDDVKKMLGKDEPACIRVELAQNKSNKLDIQGYGTSWKDPLKNPWNRGCLRQKVGVIDAYGHYATITSFGPPWKWSEFEPGQELLLYAKATQWKSDPISINEAKILPPWAANTIVPVYQGIPGKVSGKAVESCVRYLSEENLFDLAAQQCAVEVQQVCALNADQILQLVDSATKAGEPSLRSLLNAQYSLEDVFVQLHRPDSVTHALAAKRCAGNINQLALQIQAETENYRPEHPQSALGDDHVLLAKTQEALQVIESSTGFRPTDNQQVVATQIAEDLSSSRPVSGLLSGEVGAGKTVAYLAPGVAAHWMGAKVAITAPTLLLADQIAREIHDIFGTKVKVQRLEEGQVIHDDQAIIVGTESLATIAGKQNYVPNLVIFDEHHKSQRQFKTALVGPYTHSVEVSATPVGRSLALSTYSGMRLYVLNEQPVQKSINTYLVDTRDRRSTIAAINSAIKHNKRVAIILPRVLESKKQDAEDENNAGSDQAQVANVVRTQALFDKAFPGKVGVLYGSQSNEVKRRVLDQFRRYEHPILISTTVMETGISVPDIGVLIIRDPENFGSFQLHQLRGRLARKGGVGDCFLMTEDLTKLSEVSLKRLKTVEQTKDGYELAVLDMLHRGAGNFDGDEQTGKTTMLFKLLHLSVEQWLLDEENRFDLDVIDTNDEQIVDAAPSVAPKQTALF